MNYCYFIIVYSRADKRVRKSLCLPPLDSYLWLNKIPCCILNSEFNNKSWAFYHKIFTLLFNFTYLILFYSLSSNYEKEKKIKRWRFFFFSQTQVVLLNSNLFILYPITNVRFKIFTQFMTLIRKYNSTLISDFNLIVHCILIWLYY